jgi:RNA-directed DNA polymerase
VDGCSIEDFEKDLKNNLYVIWNRMSSGTYFPPPVRAVAIPKGNATNFRRRGVGGWLAGRRVWFRCRWRV